MKYNWIGFLAILFTTCQSDTNKITEEILFKDVQEVLINDTIFEVKPELISVGLYLDSKITSKFAKIEGDTLFINEELFNKISKDRFDNKGLNKLEFKSLTQNYLLPPGISDNQDRIDEFVAISNLKTNGKFIEQISNAEAGTTVHSSFYPFGQFNLDNDRSVLLSIVEWATFEACPYAEGKHLLASFLFKDNIVYSCQLARSVIGGDGTLGGNTTSIGYLTKSGAGQINFVNTLEDDFETYPDVFEYKRRIIKQLYRINSTLDTLISTEKRNDFIFEEI